MILTLTTAGLTASASSAQAEPEHDFVVTLFTDRGVEPDPSVDETFRWTDKHERVSIDWGDEVDETVTVYVEGERAGDEDPGEIAIYPGDGRTLRPGEYVDPGWQGEGQPGVGVENTSMCSPGRFRVLDASPEEDRLWVVFESHCVESRAAVFGEIRVNVPSTSDGLELSPSRVLWPDRYRREAARPVDVQLTNTGTTPQVFGSAGTSGDDSFDALDDDCSVLAPGQSCTVRTTFRPGRSGKQEGVLRLPRRDGAAVSVPLEGRGEPGFTFLRMRGSGLNKVMDRDEAVNPRNDYLSVAPAYPLLDDDFGLAVRARGYHGLFGARDGDSLALGRHKNAGYLDNGPNSHRCDKARGHYTVHEIEFDPHGNLRRLRLDFRQVCLPDRRSVLHGTVALRARTPGALPPRVRVTTGSHPVEARWRRIRLELEEGVRPREVALIAQDPYRPERSRIVERLRLRPGVRVERKINPRGYEAFFAFAGGRRPVVSDVRQTR